MERMTLIASDENILFPRLSTEIENAWVNDEGYNDADRGTPLLKEFADVYKADHADAAHLDRPLTAECLNAE
jgi:hypothetical protein